VERKRLNEISESINQKNGGEIYAAIENRGNDRKNEFKSKIYKGG